MGGVDFFPLRSMNVCLYTWSDLRTSDISWKNIISSRVGIFSPRARNFNFFLSWRVDFFLWHSRTMILEPKSFVPKSGGSFRKNLLLTLGISCPLLASGNTMKSKRAMLESLLSLVSLLGFSRFAVSLYLFTFSIYQNKRQRTDVYALKGNLSS